MSFFHISNYSCPPISVHNNKKVKPIIHIFEYFIMYKSQKQPNPCKHLVRNLIFTLHINYSRCLFKLNCLFHANYSQEQSQTNKYSCWFGTLSVVQTITGKLLKLLGFFLFGCYLCVFWLRVCCLGFFFFFSIFTLHYILLKREILKYFPSHFH